MISGRSILAICLCIAALSSYAEPARVTGGVSKHEPDPKGDGKNKKTAVIYLSPGERDAADGTSPDRALGDLQAAIDMADKKFADGYQEVTVRVLPGRYQAQTAKTAGPGAGKRLVITASGENGKAIFDGSGKADTWLRISGRVGQPTNLVVSGLRIMNYITAITMNGSRDNLDNAVSQVEIRKNVFDSIGQFRAEDKPSTAVIRLVNGDNNQIVGNRFVHYRNLQQCSLLHAIYVAHNSTGNLIKDNEFEDGCGDAIRFRDTSSNNIVQTIVSMTPGRKLPLAIGIATFQVALIAPRAAQSVRHWIIVWWLTGW